MGSLVGHAVTVYLTEETPPLRLEGRVEEERDGQLEVRLARCELSPLRRILARTLRVDVEYAAGREVWGMACRLENYGIAFPPIFRLRPMGSPRLLHRRRHARHFTNLPVRLLVRAAKEAGTEEAVETWYDGRLVNLSQGGAGVALPRVLADGDPRLFALGQEIELQFIAVEVVKPLARVVRRELGPDSLLLGLEFTSLTSHDTFALDSYLGQLETVVTK
ncbi:MAG: PilZ domain-containing protein [Betaproteobacteria bacterium]